MSPTSKDVPVAVVSFSSPRPILRLHPGDAAHVSDDIRIWTQPRPGMTVNWTALKTDQLTIIGATIRYNNADWTRIRNVATGEEGWVLSIYLVVPGDSISNVG